MYLVHFFPLHQEQLCKGKLGESSDVNWQGTKHWTKEMLSDILKYIWCLVDVHIIMSQFL
jgi:hypothetical protein